MNKTTNQHWNNTTKDWPLVIQHDSQLKGNFVVSKWNLVLTYSQYWEKSNFTGGKIWHFNETLVINVRFKQYQL